MLLADTFIAVNGLLIAIATFLTLVWYMWQHYSDWKIAVQGVVAIYRSKSCGTPLLMLKVRNHGRFPVYLHRAELVWREGGTLGRLLLDQEVVYHASVGPGDEESIQRVPGRRRAEEPLEVGHERRFFLFYLPDKVLHEVRQLAGSPARQSFWTRAKRLLGKRGEGSPDRPMDEHVWLSISSRGGEILRVKGSSFVSVLQELERLRHLKTKK